MQFTSPIGHVILLLSISLILTFTSCLWCFDVNKCLLIVVAADQLAEDITTAAVNTLSETLLTREHNFYFVALLLIQNNIDQSLPLIEEYILTINQSLFSLKTSPPITDNVTLVSADNEKVLFEIVKLHEKINSTIISLDLFNETSARNQDFVDTVGRSENFVFTCTAPFG
ncbi:hypothetical protein EB796_020603 [Bugula neritina]|uniref:Uncharacterized protein n=1 Tax=Bugula neritina TaxID=10212 RepID=A0A7J7J6N4_BUGNE|nr:hypothetical protein EB796_020603 [Bugula neritina]